MAATIKENAKATAQAARQQVEEAIAQELKPSILEARRVSYMNLIAAGMAVFAAGLALWASW